MIIFSFLYVSYAIIFLESVPLATKQNPLRCVMWKPALTILPAFCHLAYEF